MLSAFFRNIMSEDASFGQPLVGIVVLNYNGKECFSRCLVSLQNLSYKNFFVVGVDNDSRDGSFEVAQQEFPQVFFKKLSENRGFAAGMNEGIRIALEKGAQFVWVFNNDAEAEEGALTELVRVAEKEPRSGLLSPWIFDSATNSLWFGKASVKWLRMRVSHDEPADFEKKAASYESECLTGCALFLKKECLEQIGAFDDRFFLYYEDADLSLRAKKAGFKLLVVPGARVFHSEQSQSNPKKLYFLVYSGLLFFQKHAKGALRPVLSLYGTIRVIKNRFDSMRGKAGATAVRQAYDDFYHG